MVYGVSSNYNNTGFYRAAAGSIVNNQNEIESLLKFSNGMPINGMQEESIAQAAVGTLPFLGIFGGIQGLNTWKNNGLNGYALKRFKVAKKQGLAKGWQWGEMVKNINSKIPYTARNQALTAGIETVKNQYGNIFKKSVAVNPYRGKLGKILDKIPGYSKLRSTGFGQAMGKSGAGFMAVIEGGIELCTNVIPTFQQLGAGAGFKQLGKSAVKVVAGAGGWIAGDAIGKGIGAAIGTAICPGIGTAIGTFIGGFIGGILGSNITGKLATSITGKSELEKANDNQLTQYSQQIEADPNAKIQVAQQASQQAEYVLTEDPSNKDALLAKETAEKVINDTINQTAPQIQDARLAQQPIMPEAIQAAPTMAQTVNGIPVVPGFNGFGYDMNVYQNAMNNVSIPYNKQSINPFIGNPTQQLAYTQQA